MGLMGNIIFDMDGTLLDSMGMWENLGSIYLTKKGIVPPQDLKEVIENKTLEEAAEYFIADLGIEGKPVEVSHEEVQEAANKAQPLMTEIMREIIKRS